MANADHLERLWQGVEAWNAWRMGKPSVRPDLSRANLQGADLQGADLGWANLHRADFCGAHLCWAKLHGALLDEANLSGVDLRQAKLIGAALYKTNLSGADLSGADLRGATLVQTDLTGADLTGSRIYGTSVWGLKLGENTKQRDLVITPPDDPEITVDNIEVAQFIYLLLHNAKIRDAIDTITSKAVLILGRFTPERKKILDALREELRNHDYLPILFDFDKPASRTTLETVSTLAHMARFVIADLTDAKSVLQELQAVVPANPSVPVQPVILSAQEEPGMFDFFRPFPWVRETHRYDTQDQLIADLEKRVIRPAEAKVLELRGPKPG